MSGYFITGTGTNIGKTLISAIITAVLDAHYWKPIQSGIATEVSDQERVVEYIALPGTRLIPTTYLLQSALSPDQAAALQGIRIDINKLQLPKIHKNIVVEGAGGVFTPVTDDNSMMDLMQQIGLPVIVVAHGKLGTINHTLLTLEALMHRKLKVKGVIYSGDLNPANQTTIEKWSGVQTLFSVPHFENLNAAILQQWIGENRSTILKSLL